MPSPLIAALLLAASPATAPIKVAAAADLTKAFGELGPAFEKKSGQRVTLVFGSTGLLAKQIEQGAPFDVFAAANISFADEAIHAGACAAGSKALYARGRIVVWTPKGQELKSLNELVNPRFAKIAIANPEHAPYGQAAMQAFEKAGLLAAIKPKLVYGENVQQALQFAQTGNAEAALVALSLAVTTQGSTFPVEEALHQPIDQAMVVCGKDPERLRVAREFVAFVNSIEGRTVMKRFGFLLSGEVATGKP